MAKLMIVGAGAAGLWAAGTAVQMGCEVTVVEHKSSPAQKLLITGKGRCNITNACAEDEFLKQVRHNPRFLYSALYALPPEAVMNLFEEEMGLPLKVERARRVFPVSDRAEHVVAALQKRAAGALFIKGQVRQVLRNEHGDVQGVRLQDGTHLQGDAVLLATGGVSYPKTGSTGLGHSMAKELGHKIVALRPSLVSLVERGKLACRMQGLSLRNVRLSLLEDGRVVFGEQGELLFTHFGLSGPLTLSASAFVEDFEKHSYVAEIDLKPALDEETLERRIQRDFNEFSARHAANCLDKLLPQAMRAVVLELWGVEAEKKAGQITRAERARLVQCLKHFCVPLAKRGDLEHAVITAGGVDVREVNPKTMESKLCKGLYFAGEILDIDAYTGGYNLQIAWCTAQAAAKAVAQI